MASETTQTAILDAAERLLAEGGLIDKLTAISASRMEPWCHSGATVRGKQGAGMGRRLRRAQ